MKKQEVINKKKAEEAAKLKAIEDAKKAVWYLNKMIELMEKTKGKNW